jgi:hypothetical protein
VCQCTHVLNSWGSVALTPKSVLLSLTAIQVAVAFHVSHHARSGATFVASLPGLCTTHTHTQGAAGPAPRGTCAPRGPPTPPSPCAARAPSALRGPVPRAPRVPRDGMGPPLACLPRPVPGSAWPATTVPPRGSRCPRARGRAHRGTPAPLGPQTPPRPCVPPAASRQRVRGPARPVQRGCTATCLASPQRPVAANVPQAPMVPPLAC